MKSLFVPATLRKHISALAAVALVATITSTAHAVTFSAADIASTTSGELTSPGYTGVSNAFSSGTNGYNFIYTSSAAAIAGANGQYGSVGMWAVPTTSTAILALDTDFNTATSGQNSGVAVTESISGLTAGDSYVVDFNTADAQQNPYTGATEDQVQVCLATVCDTTALVDDATKSDTPWVAQSYTFTATAGTETLSFLGLGGTDPSSSSQVPAFALVDDLSITNSTPSPTPEPNSLLLLGTGLAGLGGFVRSRFKKSVATNL